jgi:hypothetical protein
MEDQVIEELGRYRNLSLRLIEELQRENYDVLDKLLIERQEIIDRCILINYPKEKFQELMDELGLQSLDIEIKELMASKRDEVKGMINKLADQRNAHKSYNSKFSVDSIYFNKKL